MGRSWRGVDVLSSHKSNMTVAIFRLHPRIYEEASENEYHLTAELVKDVSV